MAGCSSSHPLLPLFTIIIKPPLPPTLNAPPIAPPSAPPQLLPLQPTSPAQTPLQAEPAAHLLIVLPINQRQVLGGDRPRDAEQGETRDTY